jgi:DNA-binding NtrC family response regulator
MDDQFRALEAIERRIIIGKLESCHWSQINAAEQLHIPVPMLIQKMKRLKIDVREKGNDHG